MLSNACKNSIGASAQSTGNHSRSYGQTCQLQRYHLLYVRSCKDAFCYADIGACRMPYRYWYRYVGILASRTGIGTGTASDESRVIIFLAQRIPIVASFSPYGNSTLLRRLDYSRTQ